MLDPLPADAALDQRQAHQRDLHLRILGLLDGETDWIAALATLACELHHAHATWHWTGFYRVTEPGLLVIGPYQGGHGCLRIPFEQGVCGSAARSRRTQLVPDVNAFPGHIACSSTTLSEIVVPVLSPSGHVLAVLDVDSDLPAAFDRVDQAFLEGVAADLGERFPHGEPTSRM